MPDNIIQPESSILPEKEVQEPGSASEESVLKDVDEQISPEVLDDAGLQTENYILNQEIKYLRKINRAKDKLIKALRKKV